MTSRVEDFPKVVLDRYLKLYYQGKECTANSDYKSAIERFKEAMRITSPCEVLWGDIAHCYLMLNESDMTIISLRKSLEIKPDYSESLHNLGLMLSKSDLDEVLTEAEELLHWLPAAGVRHSGGTRDDVF